LDGGDPGAQKEITKAKAEWEEVRREISEYHIGTCKHLLRVPKKKKIGGWPRVGKEEMVTLATNWHHL